MRIGKRVGWIRQRTSVAQSLCAQVGARCCSRRKVRCPRPFRAQPRQPDCHTHTQELVYSLLGASGWHAARSVYAVWCAKVRFTACMLPGVLLLLAGVSRSPDVSRVRSGRIHDRQIQRQLRGLLQSATR